MLVDVMLPTYGDGHLVRESIRSVLDQRDPCWRLTVVDDGAAVGRGGDLRPWLAGIGDERIRYLANPRRLGINRNFQRCADEATADLVVVLGDDDRLLPHFVGLVREVAATHPDAAMIHTGAAVIDEHGRRATPLADRVKRLTTPRIAGRRRMGGEELAVSLLRGNWMYFPSVAFRRDVLQKHGFRDGYEVVQDLELYLRILLDGGIAVLVERPGIEYRRHSASVSSSQAGDGSRFDEESAYFAATAAELAGYGWHRAARAARWHYTSRLHRLAWVPGLVAAGRRRTAATLLRSALALPSTAADAGRVRWPRTPDAPDAPDTSDTRDRRHGGGPRR